MQQRTPELSRFLSSLHSGIKARTSENDAAGQVIEKIMDALQLPEAAAVPAPHQLPLCESLHGIVDALSDKSAAASSSSCIHPSVVEHAKAMQAISPSLHWWARPDSLNVGEPFASGHANTTVIGPGGLEERDDVWVGISLIAPNVTYPDHHHAPEEVYLVLTPGHWRQNSDEWHEPGIGGIVHNPPDIWHAMRSGDYPLLATWCLWKG